MVATQLLLAGFTAAVSVTALAPDEVNFAKLLKRQEPGTPSYNCHDACGTAITISKQPNPCASDVFKTDYEICLGCSGPDNYDIWKYYGRTLSTVGATCDLETEPKSGKQPDPSPAVYPASSTSAAAATPEAPSVISTSEPHTTAAAAVTSSTAAPTPVLPATPSVGSIVSGIPTSHTNGTASFTSSPPEQTVNTAVNLGIANCVFGLVFAAAVLGM